MFQVAWPHGACWCPLPKRLRATTLKQDAAPLPTPMQQLAILPSTDYYLFTIQRYHVLAAKRQSHTERPILIASQRCQPYWLPEIQVASLQFAIGVCTAARPGHCLVRTAQSASSCPPFELNSCKAITMTAPTSCHRTPCTPPLRP